MLQQQVLRHDVSPLCRCDHSGRVHGRDGAGHGFSTSSPELFSGLSEEPSQEPSGAASRAALVVRHVGGSSVGSSSGGGSSHALFAGPPEALGRHLVLTMVRLRDRLRGDPLLRVVFSLGNDDERTLLRERFREQVTDRLAALLTGPDPQVRAELITDQLIGLGVTLSLHRPDGAGGRTPPDRLADLYAPGLQRLIDGD
ncbi:TetR/AcrR family transcriptional regulator [Streptomyces sp. H27-G5]|nr:TetR/AcrR family transcriptional regulator [Streptomyces sp. H27-G5]